MIPATVSDYWLWRAATGPTDVAGAGIRALSGDDTARLAVWDYATEHWEADMCPFEVGQTYLIQTVTLYYVGRVKRIVGAFVELEEASWVHWTGRISTLCKGGKFSGFGSGDAKPRTEYLGDRVVGINLGSVVDYIEGPFELPTKSIA